MKFPYYDDVAMHVFRTLAEYNDYWRRVTERDANLAGDGSYNQGDLLPGATRIDGNTPLEEIKDICRAINDPRTFVQYGPLTALHQLSQLMSAGGIVDAGYIATGTPNGFIVAPSLFPQLAHMTVDEAKALAGL